ncbi:uncharacterized protein LOC117919813 [Vitis riparia]|uniref:uncharacterized protein LOC117919813 n=1 Tax=Vitis riparia TaxID=96939 RepID=UPI00155A097D|nr:uncharacterized protein LOC117919813 [Vitis riparia]
MNEADASNMGRKSDVSELGAAYEVKRTKSSKKHHAVDGRDLSVKELDSLRKDLELSEQENVVPGDHLKLGIDQTDKSEGEKEMSLNNDPNGMLSEKCRLSRCDGSEMNMKEVTASSKLLDASVGMEHQKPAVKRKKSKKAKNSVEGTPVGSNMEHAKDTLDGFASTEPHNAFNGNHSSNEADKGESILSQTERTEVLKTKVRNTSLLGVDREIDAMSGNEMESFHLTHIGKPQVNTEAMADAKVRKKTKKQSSTAKNLPDLQKKELDVGPEVSTSSTHKMKVDVPSKIKRKTKSVKTSSTNQFKRSKLGTEKDAGTEVESLHPKQDSGTFDSSQIPSSYALENNPVGRPLEANVDGNLLKLACINEANDHKEVSSCQSDMVNMPRQSLHKVVAPAQVLADEDTKVKRSERVSKTNKNKKISNVDSVATSRDLQNSLKTNKSQDVEKKSEGDNQLQDPLSMDGHNKLMPESDSKFSKVSRNDLKSPHDIGKFDTIPEEIRWPNVVNASGTSSTAHAFLKENGKASLSTSSSDSSEDRTYQNKRGKRQSNLDRYRVTVRKAPRKNPGEVVNSSHQRKSLLATYGSIFNDGGSESSEDHNGVENSDASTRTPSDSSASSDYTEGENNQHLDSSHGLYSAKRNESGAKSIGKSNSSGSKNVTMDVILRSSSRFKKAKLTASQSELNDTESQPVEFVPDSQANL